MTLQAFFDQAEADQVATTTGWRDFTAWALSLPERLAEPRHLVMEGWSERLDLLAEQLRAGLRRQRPGESARSVAEGLLEQLNFRPADASVLTVSDGVGDASED